MEVFKDFHFPWTPKSFYQMVLMHPKLDSVSIIMLLGTEFIISHTFQCERYFFLLVLDSLIKSIIRVMILLDTVPYINSCTI